MTTTTLITIISKLMENVHDGKNPPMMLLENDAGRKWISMLCSDGKCAQMQSPGCLVTVRITQDHAANLAKWGFIAWQKKQTGRETHSEIPMNESKQ